MANGRGKAENAGAFSMHPGHGSAKKTVASHEFNKSNPNGSAMSGMGSAKASSSHRGTLGY